VAAVGLGRPAARGEAGAAAGEDAAAGPVGDFFPAGLINGRGLLGCRLRGGPAWVRRAGAHENSLQ